MKLNNSIQNRKILIAPLNWGLGHATRCMPIINALLLEGFEPILAGDGDSLSLLQKEFPDLKWYKLPSYNIRYTKSGTHLKYKLLFDSGKILIAVKKEKDEVEKIIEKENIKGIISDNRFGVRSQKVPSVYITHQLNVLSGISTNISSKVHQKIIGKFDECWVPDYKGDINLAGKLSHLKYSNLNIKYIGPLSRFDSRNSSQDDKPYAKKFEVMVLLSGPEPQRSLLEEKLLIELKNYDKKVLFVRGLISEDDKLQRAFKANKNIKIINFLFQNDLQKAINESEIILTRSGYSTIMDLERLNAKAFFIPTPGQFEQEYLAKHLIDKNIALYASQDKFKIEMLKTTENYQGFKYKKPYNFQLPFEIFTNKNRS